MSEELTTRERMLMGAETCLLRAKKEPGHSPTEDALIDAICWLIAASQPASQPDSRSHECTEDDK